MAEERRHLPVSIQLNNLATGLCLALLVAIGHMVWDTHDAILTVATTMGQHEKRMDDFDRQLADLRRHVHEQPPDTL